MQGPDFVKIACLAAALCAFAPSEAEAIGALGGLSSPGPVNDGIALAAAVHRGVVRRPPGHAGYRPGAPGRRPGHPGYYPPAYRPAYQAWARPDWYRWGPGGAVAAGAAIGFVTAATASAWAGAPPQPGLCWYYTDPSRQQGFWDQCP